MSLKATCLVRYTLTEEKKYVDTIKVTESLSFLHCAQFFHWTFEYTLSHCASFLKDCQIIILPGFMMTASILAFKESLLFFTA